MSGFQPTPNGRVIARYSCGAASAVATKLSIEKYGDAVEIFYTDTASEHSDNIRFRRDCEQWFGKPVTVLRSEEFRDVDDVIEKTRYLVSNKGARCTGALKKIPGDAVWNYGDTEIFGYHASEGHRLARWQEHNNERIIECPLIDRGISKEEALGVLKFAGIEIPMMYRLGFENNNCIGCVKARDNINYWKRVRKFFPDVFNRRARQERELGIAINRRTRGKVRRELFLDEIEEGDPKGADLSVACGIFCMSENQPTP